MRKKIFTFLLALATSVGMMYAAVDDSGDCGANVTYSFNGATGAMTITGTGPMTVFSSGTAPWKNYKADITSVVVEDGVTSVSQYSFSQCTNLTTVVIGNDVETIGQFAFNDCGASFTSLTLGSSLKSVGMAAFLNAHGITTLTLPDGFETVGDYAFCRLEALQTLNIPSSVTNIGVSAFYRCYPLATINCAAVTPPSLGDDAFGDIANKSNIPLNVPNGSVAAYEAAAQWTDFDIQGYDPAPAPANVCGDGLTWELNGGVLTISYDGVGTGEMTDFDYEYDENPVNVAPWKENKSAITTVIVGDGVKSIGNYAFNDLYENFTAVTIANSVERIGVFAFTNAKWITEITLPSSLKTIDRQCFSANFGITSITIPSGVTSIGYKAFSYCTGLTSLTCEATTPPTLASGVFSKIRQSAASISSIPLYVPSGSVAAYEAAAQWNAFDIHGYDPAPTPEPEPEPAGYTEVSSFEALQTALQAGNNVRLTANISCTSDITLNNEQKLILDGNGFALNGAGSHRAFYFGGDVTIVMKDLTINAFDLDAGGGVIRNYGTLVLDGCTVSGNHTDGTNQGGGAIENGNNAKLYAYNTTFSGNYSSEIGGAINNYRGNLYLANCSFENNYTSSSSAYYGGAIGVNQGNQVRIINCSFSENKYGTNAGASDLGIYNNPSEYTIAGCTGITIQPKSGSMTTYTYGTATLDYSDLNDIQFSYTYTNTPEQAITPYADPQDASVYYSTFYDSNFKYELPEGVEAYVADLSGANLLLTKIAEGGQVIPADNAVILKSTVTSIVLTPSDADAVTFTATNDLQGSDTQIATPANCYVLAGTNGVGFYHYNGANLNPHKAYVIYSGSNQAPHRMPFVFEQTTGVENVQNSDIRSQKVVENGQLIIIKNGVKYNAQGQIVK